MADDEGSRREEKHNQNPLIPPVVEKDIPRERSFTEYRPTSSSTDHEPTASHEFPNPTRASSSPPSDETSVEAPDSLDKWPNMSSDEDFENALLAYGRRKGFMLGLFLLCASPGILNGFHVMVYVIYSYTPKHWCSVPVLEAAKWTPEQIRNVSSPRPEDWSNCEYYDEDYERLRQMGYEKAFQKVRKEVRPTTSLCAHFSYDNVENLETSLVTQWDLVCGRLALKATVQTAISLGKLLGAPAFGILADKCGRKIAFTLASFLYMLSGPIVAFTSLYQVMITARICLGIASLGVYESAYALITEICPPELRPAVGVTFNHSYPLGIIIISVIGYYIRDWRKLQLCISVPAFLLIVHIWLIPESPRWLYYSGRKKQAWMAVKKFLPRGSEDLTVVLQSREHRNSSSTSFLCMRRMCTLLKYNIQFFKDSEFRKRLFICWAVWCFTSMSYYALSINSDYFRHDVYLYIGLSGVVECVSYIIALPWLHVFGRRTATSSLLLFGSIALISLIIIPKSMRTVKFTTALFGRLCVSAVFSIIIVHLCELFPTTIRNSALGSSSTLAHVGSTLAPYVVDFIVIYGRWLPSTICAVALLTAGLLAQTLPETRDLDLYNTLQDFTSRCKANRKERVSFENCTLFYLYRKCKSPR